MTNLLHPSTDTPDEIKSWLTLARREQSIASHLVHFLDTHSEVDAAIIENICAFRDALHELAEQKGVTAEEYGTQCNRLGDRYSNVIRAIVEGGGDQKIIESITDPMLEAAVWGGAGILSGKVTDEDLDGLSQQTAPMSDAEITSILKNDRPRTGVSESLTSADSARTAVRQQLHGGGPDMEKEKQRIQANAARKKEQQPDNRSWWQRLLRRKP